MDFKPRSFCTRLFILVDLLVIDNILGFDSENYCKNLFLFPFLSLGIEIRFHELDP